MEFFENAQFVRLRSHLGSYLCAGDCREAVSHSYRRNSPSTVWAVELAGDYIRLLGQQGLYLWATDIPAALDRGGAAPTCCKVRQGVPSTPNDNAFLWSPRLEGQNHLTLSGPFGRLLRASVGPTPQDNTVTVDFGVDADKSFWVVEVVVQAEAAAAPPCRVRSYRARAKAGLHALFPPGKVAPSAMAMVSTKKFVDPSMEEGLHRPEPRTIFYNTARDDGSVDKFNDGTWKYFMFNEQSLLALRRRLEKETGCSSLVICRQSNTGGRLFPVVLDLPPGNNDMEFVLALELSRVAKGLKWPEGHGQALK